MAEVTIKLTDLQNEQVNLECECKPDISQDEDPTPAQAIAIAVLDMITQELGEPKKLRPQ